MIWDGDLLVLPVLLGGHGVVLMEEWGQLKLHRLERDGWWGDGLCCSSKRASSIEEAGPTVTIQMSS